jgi:hypothetical protein
MLGFPGTKVEQDIVEVLKRLHRFHAAHHVLEFARHLINTCERAEAKKDKAYLVLVKSTPSLVLVPASERDDECGG